MILISNDLCDFTNKVYYIQPYLQEIMIRFLYYHYAMSIHYECNNLIGDIGCKYLKQANLMNLKELNLFGNLIRDIGMIWLLKSNFSQLISLYIGFDNITKKAINAIVYCDLNSLKCLQLRHEHFYVYSDCQIWFKMILACNFRQIETISFLFTKIMFQQINYRKLGMCYYRKKQKKYICKQELKKIFKYLK